MAFVEGNHVVEQISPTTVDPPFGDPIPAKDEGCPDRLQSGVGDSRTDFLSELPIPIMNQESVLLVEGKTLRVVVA